jgi:hypothetical protein
MTSPYRLAPSSPQRSRFWRFRMWLARLVAPANEDAFLDRWDVTEHGKRLALAWDRGYIGRVEWNPECMNCGTPAPFESHCRECGSFERRIKDRADIIKARIRVQQSMLEYIESKERLPKMPQAPG